MAKVHEKSDEPKMSGKVPMVHQTKCHAKLFRLPFVLLLCSYHPAKISNVATALSTCAD